MSSDETVNLEALEDDILRDMDPSQAGRVRKILRLLTKLLGPGLSDRPGMILGYRGQFFFVNKDVEELERTLVNVYRYATLSDLQLMVALLEIRDVTISEASRVARVGIPIGKRCMFTRKGRVVF